MIYYIDNLSEINSDLVLKLINLLPPRRKQQAQRYLLKEDQINCAVAYHILKYAVRREFGVEIKEDFLYDELYHKPRCRENAEIHFSISHCKYAVACFVSNIDVGIDVEDYRSFNNINPHYILSKEEYSYFKSCDKKLLFLAKAWTVKEAVAKCSGIGIDDSVLSTTYITDYSSGRVYHQNYYILNRWIGTKCMSICSPIPVDSTLCKLSLSSFEL